MDTTKTSYIPALKWHWATSYYDRFIALTMPEREIKDKVIELTDLKPNEKALDFGCGTGTGLLIGCKKESKASFYGYDVDPEILNIAKGKLPDTVRLDLGERSDLPYSDAYFDKVWSTWVFHHLKNDEKEKALCEIKRVLKPNGVFVLGDWGRPQNGLMSLLFFILQLVDNFSTTNANKKGAIPHLIREAGFTSIEEKAYRNTIFGTFRYWLVRS